MHFDNWGNIEVVCVNQITRQYPAAGYDSLHVTAIIGNSSRWWFGVSYLLRNGTQITSLVLISPDQSLFLWRWCAALACSTSLNEDREWVLSFWFLGKADPHRHPRNGVSLLPGGGGGMASAWLQGLNLWDFSWNWSGRIIQGPTYVGKPRTNDESGRTLAIHRNIIAMVNSVIFRLSSSRVPSSVNGGKCHLLTWTGYFFLGLFSERQGKVSQIPIGYEATDKTTKYMITLSLDDRGTGRLGIIKLA